MATETYTPDQLIVGDAPVKTKLVTLLLGAALSAGLILKKIFTAVIAAGAGNTGDGAAGAVTIKKAAKIGAYVLTCIGLGGSTLTAGAVTAGGGNTGDGTSTAATLGADAKAGTYTLTCTDLGPATITAGAVTAGGGNTGDGVAGAATAGSAAIVGTYTLTCIDASVSGSEIFEVLDPNGVKLDDLTVAVAYLNNHFGLTIADGAADFIVGDTFTIAMTGTNPTPIFEVVDPDGFMLDDLTVGAAYSNDHFALTLSDGATDFVVGDVFTIAVAAANNVPVFNCIDPDGYRLADLTIGSAYDNGHFAVTIADGATDFVVGDAFTVTVSDSGKCTGYDDVTGQAPFAGILMEDVDASLADAYGTAYLTGSFRSGALTLGGAATLTDRLKQMLEARGCFIVTAQAIV